MTKTAATDNKNKPDFPKKSCLYCKKLGHLIKDCRKRIRKEQEQKQDVTQNVKGFTPKTYSSCPHCQKTNHPPEKCQNGTNAANRPPSSERHPPSSDNQENPMEGTSTQKTPPSIFKNPSNYQGHDSNGQM